MQTPKPYRGLQNSHMVDAPWSTDLEGMITEKWEQQASSHPLPYPFKQTAPKVKSTIAYYEVKNNPKTLSFLPKNDASFLITSSVFFCSARDWEANATTPYDLYRSPCPMPSHFELVATMLSLFVPQPVNHLDTITRSKAVLAFDSPLSSFESQRNITH